MANVASDCLIITAADSCFFELAQGCIQSVRSHREVERVSIAFFDLGCTDKQREWLRSNVNFIVHPDWEFDFPNRDNLPQYVKGLLVRPFLRRYFPGHEIYLWLDADSWVQNWRAVDLFCEGARKRRGLSIVPEIDRNYRTQYGEMPYSWQLAKTWYAQGHGPVVANRLHSYPMLNAGVFALHQTAPHWQIWEEELQSALLRTCTIVTDQIALNVTVYARDLLSQTELLPAWCNLACHHALPAWDEHQGCLVEPHLPHTPIGIVHLTVEKKLSATLTTTSGRQLEVGLQFPAQPMLPAPPEAWDYLALGLEPIRPDQFFPNMVVGDKKRCAWPFLRREIPHNWYVDRRIPTIGFLNRDEAFLLYNTALMFRGKRGLEIGCWLGWSACDLALAGVRLDVIDPLLERADIHASVTDSLRAAGVLDAVNLVAGPSPDKVHELAAGNTARWDLIFIDGNHDAPGPLQDAIACEAHAAADALILFHDLVSPDVAQGLDFLADKGWRTILYQTMQIMGAAWRGDVRPVNHVPDPAVAWTMLPHLRRHPISGGDTKAQLSLANHGRVGDDK